MDKPLVFVHDRRMEGIWPLVLAPLIALLIVIASKSYVQVESFIAPLALILVAIPGAYRIFWGRWEVVVDRAKGEVLQRHGPGRQERRLASLADVQRADVALVYRGTTPMYRPYLLLKNNTRVELLPDCEKMQEAHAPAATVNDAINLSPETRSRLAMSHQKPSAPSAAGASTVLWLVVIALVLIAIVALAITTVR